MTTRKETVDYLLEQLEPLEVRARAMFGEYCLWCDEKVVALICNETLYLKPSVASDGRGFSEEEAYPGSRQFRVVGPDIVEVPEAFKALIQATANALPKPKPKRKRDPGRN